MATKPNQVLSSIIYKKALHFLFEKNNKPLEALNHALNEVFGNNEDGQKKYYFQRLRSMMEKAQSEMELHHKELEQQSEESNWGTEKDRLIDDFPNMREEDYNPEFYKMIKKEFTERELNKETENNEGIERFRVR